MPDVTAGVTTEFLQAFADAWNRHDADVLMTFMTEDCVFEAPAGPGRSDATFWPPVSAFFRIWSFPASSAAARKTARRSWTIGRKARKPESSSPASRRGSAGKAGPWSKASSRATRPD